MIIPKSVKTIKSCAFRGCEKLSSVILQEGLETIEYGCFGGNNRGDNSTVISEIIIPKSVRSTENYAIYNCNNLVNVTL